MLIFGLGILCGMLLQTILFWLYASIRINNIDKK